MVFLFGLMEENTLEIGIKENKMEQENMSLLMGKLKLGNGYKEKDLIGLRKKKFKGKMCLFLKSSSLLLMLEINTKYFIVEIIYLLISKKKQEFIKI